MVVGGLVEAIATFLMIVGACMIILFIMKVKNPMLNKWSYIPHPLQIMLIIEPRMVTTF